MWQQGLSLLQQGKSQEAVDVLWQAATADPGCFEARLYLGVALGQVGRNEEAVRELHAALSINPQSAPAQYDLGVIFQRAGRHQEALAAYEAALRVDPSYERAQQAAEALRAAGVTQAAVAAPVAAAPAEQRPWRERAVRREEEERRRVGLTIGIVVASVLVVVVLTAWVLNVRSAVTGGGRSGQQQCLSHLKQLALGQLMYATDWDEVMPPADAWCDATMPYIRKEAIYACPAARESPWGYAMNSDLSRVSMWAPSSPRNPAQTITMYDSTTGSKNANDPLTSLPSPGRHQRGNNYAFMDGHAKWYSDSEPPGTGGR